MYTNIMENHQVILQDEHFNRYKIVRVRDIYFDAKTLMNTAQWLWVFSESYEFFPFELWDRLNHAQLDETIYSDHKKFKVIKITKRKKPKFS